MTDFFGLTGKVALVIGGGMGIGETTSLRLADAGCDVAVVDIDLARAERVADEIRKLGRNATAIAADVLDEATAPDVVAQTEAALGRLDILITIVGQATIAPALEITPELWDLEHRRNLRYFFFYAQAAAKAMVRSGRGGVITALGSITGMECAPSHSAYGAAKAGMISLVKSLSVELAPYDIRVNVVAPGVIKTPRIAEGPDFQAWEDRIRNSLVPARRLGETKEVADAILYVSSDLATYVTGATIAVDGGFTAQWALGDGAREKTADVEAGRLR
jgi:NAD(P)-dependent dehydrogenase (short-subunit alcohol dehydrogenase family)